MPNVGAYTMCINFPTGCPSDISSLELPCTEDI
jgi:hypothetical protein